MAVANVRSIREALIYIYFHKDEAGANYLDYMAQVAFLATSLEMRDTAEQYTKFILLQKNSMPLSRITEDIMFALEHKDIFLSDTANPFLLFLYAMRHVGSYQICIEYSLCALNNGFPWPWIVVCLMLTHYFHVSNGAHVYLHSRIHNIMKSITDPISVYLYNYLSWKPISTRDLEYDYKFIVELDRKVSNQVSNLITLYDLILDHAKVIESKAPSAQHAFTLGINDIPIFVNYHRCNPASATSFTLTSPALVTKFMRVCIPNIDKDDCMRDYFSAILDELIRTKQPNVAKKYMRVMYPDKTEEQIECLLQIMSTMPLYSQYFSSTKSQSRAKPRTKYSSSIPKVGRRPESHGNN